MEKELNTPKKSSQNSLFIDRAKGCIYGSLIGDAWGAPLEFTRNIDKSKVNWAKSMPGGGPIQVGPGQVTDDSELAICLFEGLRQGMLKENLTNLEQPLFLPDNIARMYGKWIRSPPFDIGNTTRNALNTVRNKNIPNPSNTCTSASYSLNTNSQSNGSTMRMAPLAVYLSQLESEEDIFKAIKIDTNHTHSNPIIEECNFAIALCVRALLNGATPEEAYNIVKIYTENCNTDLKLWFEEMEQNKC